MKQNLVVSNLRNLAHFTPYILPTQKETLERWITSQEMPSLAFILMVDMAWHPGLDSSIDLNSKAILTDLSIVVLHLDNTTV